MGQKISGFSWSYFHLYKWYKWSYLITLTFLTVFFWGGATLCTPRQDVIGGVGTLIFPCDSHVMPSTHDPGMNYIQLRSDHLWWFYSLDYLQGGPLPLINGVTTLINGLLNYKQVTGVITLLSGNITLLTSGRGPACTWCHSTTSSVLVQVLRLLGHCSQWSSPDGTTGWWLNNTEKGTLGLVEHLGKWTI